MTCRNEIGAMFSEKSRSDLLDYACNRIDKNEEQHSVYAVKFYTMQKQIDELEDFSEQLMEERNIYKNIVNELKELLSNPYNQDCVVQNNDFLNKIFELEKK